MLTDHLAAVLLRSADAFADRPAVAGKTGGQWVTRTFREVAADSAALAQALVGRGVGPGDTVAIFSANRPEWLITDFGILSARAVTVPLYATNTAAQAEYVVADAGPAIVFVGNQQQYDAVDSFRARVPAVRLVVALDPDVDLRGRDSSHLGDLLAEGYAAVQPGSVERRLAAATPQDVATIIYTSGTTGEPKGAVLTHANFIHQLNALDERFSIGPDDRSLCFLPLSHAYERGWTMYVMAHGAANYLLADTGAVIEALAEVRPTLMVSVPRLFEKVYAGVQDRLAASSPVKRRLARWALDVGATYQRQRQQGAPPGLLLRARHSVADRLVLSSIRDVLGGEKNVLAAGGAPLASEIEEFFLAAGILICQGYGMTETTAMLTCNYPGGVRFGTVGRPVAGVEIKIAEDGEILARGGNVMREYHRKPAETAEVLEGGWLHTGDIGELDADGYLRVTDRIKDIIITSQGKNVAPQHIETQFSADPFLEQVVVVGDRRAYLTALVQPNFPAVEEWARAHGVHWTTREELVSDPAVVEMVGARLDAESGQLAGYERVKRFTLVPHEFTQAEGELTPTLKIRRRVVEERYHDLIDAMYG